jgi:hypothetical protein
MNLYVTPGMPYFTAAVAGAILAALGLLFMERRQVAVAGMQIAPSPTSMSRRYLVGNLAGLPIAAAIALLVIAANIQGNTRLLMLAAAIAVYLYLALVIPRRPLVKRQKDAAMLRKLTPGYISFVRVALGSFEAPMDIMRRYVARPVKQNALMQELVGEAINLGLDKRLRPFAALSTVAKERGCRELTDVAEALAQAEAEGGRIDTVLIAQQATLELILQSEFKRMLRRRTMYLLLMVAISLVVGILINLLWVMTGGGSVLMLMR